MTSVETTFLKAINTALGDAMRADERVIVLGEDVAEGGPYGGTAGLAEEFGTERVRTRPGCDPSSRSCTSTSSRSRSTSS
jgi:acetoin:2,6-dichlorophenolindophenol oxidoreductase subunit beta